MLRALLVLAAALAFATSSGASARDVKIVPLEGGAPPMALSDLRGRPHIALVWRSDCAPCLIELRSLAALERAAGHAQLITIALEPADKARAALTRLSAAPHSSFAALGDAAAFLAAVSDGGQRLPLALALDRYGHICRRHVGLLGSERAQAWARQC